MTSRYAQPLFTGPVQVQVHQERHDSRRNYATMGEGPGFLRALDERAFSRC